MKRGQYTFTLHNIKYKNLIEEYYSSNKRDTETIEYENNTNVTTIIPTNNKYIFYDLNKGKFNSLTTMVDIITQKYLPLSTDKACWWCGYTFDSCPIGLPLKYHENNGKVNDMYNFLKSRNLSTEENDYFETEGIYCSFPCCKADIIDKQFNSRYKNSLTLLTLLYKKLFGDVVDIPKAPSWKLLEMWSGPLTIQQFRKNFGRYIYYETPNIKRPFMFTVGHVIEEVKL